MTATAENLGIIVDYCFAGEGWGKRSWNVLVDLSYAVELFRFTDISRKKVGLSLRVPIKKSDPTAKKFVMKNVSVAVANWQ